MTSPTGNNPLSAIEELLAERQRFEAWLATLETRREVTPAHVYERVREDYEKRLREVMDRLQGRSGDLRALVDSLTTRVSTLQKDETARRDALAEAELRALVGEYAPDEWEKIRKERDEELARLAAERTGIGGELTKVQELLSAADAAPRFATPAPGVVAAPPQPPAPAPEPARPAAAAPAAPPSPAPAAPPKGGSFDELAFLQSVIDTRVPGGAAAADAPVASPAPVRADGVGETARMLAEDLAQQIQGGDASPPQRTTAPAMPRPANPAPEPRAAAAAPAAPAPPEPRRSGESVPAFLRDVPEQSKTLKCQECGTMNYPTEWYCERCGGELAAM